jgi:choline dehydrogenase-like flavoprotein
MIADGRTVSQDETVDADICIVGAGVAGVALAREFAGAGLQVILLESGDLKPDPATQSLYEGANVGHEYYRLDEARARFFGGSANYWDVEVGKQQVAARLRPLDDIDFEQRDWVPYSGWPFGRCHLEPYYERAQGALQIDDTSYDVHAWEDPNRRSLPLDGDVQTVIFKFVTRDAFLGRYRSAITHAEDVIAIVYANAVAIETNDAANVVTRVRVACLEGKQFWVAARVVGVAAGGIEVPRLLLNSTGTQKTGLANAHDMVGRFFMEHLHFWSGMYVPAHADLFDSMGLYCGIHAVRGVYVIGKLALTERALRRERLLNQNIQLFPELTRHGEQYGDVVSRATASLRVLRSAGGARMKPERLVPHLANVATGIDDIARYGYRKVRRRLAARNPHRPLRAFRLAHMTEQIPNPESRVTLGSDCDRFGLRRVRLDWRLSALDMRSVVRTQAIVDSALRRGGLGRLHTELRDETLPPGEIPWSVHGGYHHMGTTRMHTDPRKGVVDADCRVHGIDNLFISGPSVFPTGGYANPVLTTVALALRLADHLKVRMKAAA